jgi:SpoVK/Ycf46/Vps4 family AAA+-type ATPase
MQLWNLLLPTEVPRADDITVEWLAQESIDLAGGDILNVVKLAASQAVVRTGEERKILQSDIRNAVIQVKLGKEKVGTGFTYDNQSTTTVVEEKIVPLEELPSDVREKYEQVLEQDNVSDAIAVGT